MDDDLLGLSQNWVQSVDDPSAPYCLVSLEEALENSSLKRGINRRDFLAELLKDVHHQRLIPLLAMLPRGWRQSPAALPQYLRGLGTLLGDGLISPLMLAAFADDLQHLVPSKRGESPTAVDRWGQRFFQDFKGSRSKLPIQLDALHIQCIEFQHAEQNESKTRSRFTFRELTSLGGEIIWSNHGLSYLQSEDARHRNQLMAQIFNALGSNVLLTQNSNINPFRFEGQSSGKDLIATLNARGWTCVAKVRTSVASFGLGASTYVENYNQWCQIPLGVPYRTGLQGKHQNEMKALLPHACLEMELTPPEGESVLLQYYQGTEGLNGWAAMNDLDRPWQNGRFNGTVCYSERSFTGEELAAAVDLCELMGAVHNTESSLTRLHLGGYGAIGFCIDSTALIEQAITGRTRLFPLTLGGLWREKLNKQLNHLLEKNLRPHGDSVERYRIALESMPQDLFHNSETREDAERRLFASQPANTPFLLIQDLKQDRN